jgi:predicted ATPase
MKISKLEIFDYNQFRNFTIDLTYPKGHKKEGLPLDKVCFIGQNGTGKTTILNIINELVTNNFIHTDLDKTEDNKLFEITVDYPFTESKRNKVYKVSHEGAQHFMATLDIPDNKSPKFKEYLSGRKTKLINIPVEMIDWDLSHKIENPLAYLKPTNELEKEIISEKDYLFKKSTFDFRIDNPIEIWKSILLENSEYLLKEIGIKSKIADELLKANAQTEQIIEDLKKWKSQNPNPFLTLAKKLNPILEPFQLKVKTDIDIRSVEDLFFIQIQSLSDDIIPFTGWSSGTKQIILTAAPLIKLNTWQSIILIDEPERSLYPDTQYKIIDYYSQMSPDAQFFIATHSPIVASAFEPWEIIELRFDEDGKIKQYLYYTGERQVDNYFIQPQYLRWDSILYKLFDLKKDGNNQRSVKLRELSEMGVILKQLKDQESVNVDEVKKRWFEYKKMAELLDWKIEEI